MKISKSKFEFYLAESCMSKKELALKAKINPGSISRILKSNNSVYPHTVKKIANALNVAVGEIIEETKEEA